MGEVLQHWVLEKSFSISKGLEQESDSLLLPNFISLFISASGGGGAASVVLEMVL